MKAAFGRVNLTPDNYRGKPLAGYGNFCYGKLDDIHGSAFLFENSGNYLILFSLDFLKLPIAYTDYLKSKIQTQFAIPPENVLVHCTHTHKSFDQGGEFQFPTGIVGFMKGIMFGSYYMDDRYNVWVSKKLLYLIEKLKSELIECEIAWTKKKIEDNLIINRRHPDRKSKSDLGIIDIREKKSKKNIGLIVTYAMHPTTLNSQINMLSADYPGILVNHLHKISDYKLNVAFFTSPAGDINPITTCGTDFDELAKEHKNTLINENSIYSQWGTYEDTKRIGQILAEKTFELYKTLQNKDYFDKMEFNTHLRRFIIPMKDFTKYKSKVWFGNRLKFLFKKHILIRFPLIMSESKKPNFPGFSVRRQNSEFVVESVVHYITIGTKDKKKNLSISGIPGELFEDIAEEFYNNSPLGRKNTFIFQNSNDWIAYLLPLNEYITVGGYEAFTSFSPLAGEYVRKNYYKLLKDAEPV